MNVQRAKQPQPPVGPYKPAKTRNTNQQLKKQYLLTTVRDKENRSPLIKAVYKTREIKQPFLFKQS